MRVSAKVFKNLMKIAKEDKFGRVTEDEQRKLNEMMSRDEEGESYSVEVDVSQLIFHDIDSSIHYATANGDDNNTINAEQLQN